VAQLALDGASETMSLAELSALIEALLLVAPEFYSTAIGVSLLAAVIIWQAVALRAPRVNVSDL